MLSDWSRGSNSLPEQCLAFQLVLMRLVCTCMEPMLVLLSWFELITFIVLIVVCANIKLQQYGLLACMEKKRVVLFVLPPIYHVLSVFSHAWLLLNCHWCVCDLKICCHWRDMNDACGNLEGFAKSYFESIADLYFEISLTYFESIANFVLGFCWLIPQEYCWLVMQEFWCLLFRGICRLVYREFCRFGTLHECLDSVLPAKHRCISMFWCWIL